MLQKWFNFEVLLPLTAFAAAGVGLALLIKGDQIAATIFLGLAAFLLIGYQVFALIRKKNEIAAKKRAITALEAERDRLMAELKFNEKVIKDTNTASAQSLDSFPNEPIVIELFPKGNNDTNR